MEATITSLKDFLSAFNLTVPSDADSRVSVGWHMPQSTVMMIIHAMRPQDFAMQLELPSTSISWDSWNPSSLASELTSCAGSDQRPNQDEQGTDFVWTINWQYTVAKYKSDLDTYIWQPHCNPPPFCYSYLLVSTSNAPCVPRALILFSTARSLKSFRQQYDSTSTTFFCMQPSAIGLLHALYAVLKVALTETKVFLQDVSQQIFDMVRHSPQVTQQTLISHRTDFSVSSASNKREISTSIVPQRLQKKDGNGHD